MATGILDAPLTGDEVLRTAKVAAHKLERLVVGVLAGL
jgi:hypothetical protein